MKAGTVTYVVFYEASQSLSQTEPESDPMVETLADLRPVEVSNMLMKCVVLLTTHAQI